MILGHDVDNVFLHFVSDFHDTDVYSETIFSGHQVYESRAQVHAIRFGTSERGARAASFVAALSS